MVNRRFQRPQRSYIDELKAGFRIGGVARKAGRLAEHVGNELIRGGSSPADEMRKAGHKHFYARSGKNKRVFGTKQAAGYLATEKSMDPHTRALLAEAVRQKGTKVDFDPSQKGVRAKDLEKHRDWFEKQFGKPETELLFKSVGLGQGMNPDHSLFAKGRQRNPKEVLEHFQRTARKFIPKHKQPYLNLWGEVMAHPTYADHQRKGRFTQQAAAELEGQLDNILDNPKAVEAAKIGYRRALQAEDISGGEGESAKPQLRRVMGFAKRSKNQDASQGKILPFSQLKEGSVKKDSISGNQDNMEEAA